jgi:hypothetical protein
VRSDEQAQGTVANSNCRPPAVMVQSARLGAAERPLCGRRRWAPPGERLRLLWVGCSGTPARRPVAAGLRACEPAMLIICIICRAVGERFGASETGAAKVLIPCQTDSHAPTYLHTCWYQPCYRPPWACLPGS